MKYLAGTEDADPGIRGHAEQCESCRTLLSQWLAVFQLASRLEVFSPVGNEEVSAETLERLLKRVDAEYQTLIREESACPERDRLASWLAGNEVDSRTRHHVESCDACRTRMERLLGVLRHAAAAHGFDVGVEATGPMAGSEVEPLSRERAEQIFESLTASSELPFSTSPACPDRESLLGWLAGDEQHSLVRPHLESCNECQMRVSRLLGVYRVAAQGEAFAGEYRNGIVADMPNEAAERIFAQVNRQYEREIGEPAATIIPLQTTESPDQTSTAAEIRPAKASAAAASPRTLAFIRTVLPYASAACVLIGMGTALLLGFRDHRRLVAMNHHDSQERLEVVVTRSNKDLPNTLRYLDRLIFVATKKMLAFLPGTPLKILGESPAQAVDKAQEQQIKDLMAAGDIEALKRIKDNLGDDGRRLVDEIIASIDGARPPKILDHEFFQRVRDRVVKVRMPEKRKTRILEMIAVLELGELT